MSDQESLTFLLHSPELNISRCQSSVFRPCAFCHKQGQFTRRCGNCIQEYYCSGGCQRKHWRKEHRLVCQFIKLSVKREDADDDSDDDDVGDQPPPLVPGDLVNRHLQLQAPKQSLNSQSKSPVASIPHRLPMLGRAAATAAGDTVSFAATHRTFSGARQQPPQYEKRRIGGSSAVGCKQVQPQSLSLHGPTRGLRPPQSQLNLPLLLCNVGPVKSKRVAPLMHAGAGPMPPLAKLQHAGTAWKIHTAMLARGQGPHQSNQRHF